MNDTAIAVRENGMGGLAPRFVVSLAELKRGITELHQFYTDIMQEGTDFGKIPGTDKPTLLKPGAEKLTVVFGLRPEFRVLDSVKDWERGFFYYQVDCSLTSRQSGEVLGNGIGSCNTRESRYRWRMSQRTCPECHAAAIAQSKAEWGGGFYCNKKAGGCTSKFAKDDPRITSQSTGRVENDDPYSLDNTVLKMAEKRALVAATLVVTAASGIFTQDVEDFSEGDYREVAPADSVQGRTPPAAASAAPAPTEPTDREALWARWETLRDKANALGITRKDGGPLTDPPKRVTDAKLKEWCDGLDAEITRRKKESVAQDAAAFADDGSDQVAF